MLLTTLVRTTLRAQPRYHAMLAQGGPRRRRTKSLARTRMKSVTDNLLSFATLITGIMNPVRLAAQSPICQSA
ncbi:exported hypothetical protein [Mesorhizobium sp. SOD10]|nr:exported hypothetical protein [Mesorhizobium sp. SOD10]